MFNSFTTHQNTTKEDGMTEIKFRSDVVAEEVTQVGGDDFVLHAARISTDTADTGRVLKAGELEGVINFLMKNRHGCYDSETEVLTDTGWIAWPNVTGDETFATLNLGTDKIEYQQANRLVVRPAKPGEMLRIKKANVDFLVTGDHNMLAAPRTRDTVPYELHPAKDFLDRSYRVKMTGGKWVGGSSIAELASYIGFFAGDGSGSADFHLKKKRKIDFLQSFGYEVSVNNDTYRVLGLPEEWRAMAKACYDDNREKRIPRELINLLDANSAEALIEGYMIADGSVSHTGAYVGSSTSQQLVDDLQEIGLKCGVAIVQNATRYRVEGDGSYGTKPLHRFRAYKGRNTNPRIGWTTRDRATEVTQEDYDGDVYCVTVPNGTLYVRRNGKPAWCGNTPFEHNMFTFYVEAPIFVFREAMRHRIGWSFNEMSGRYTELLPEFYIPGEGRAMIREEGTKTGQYAYLPDENRREWFNDGLKGTCTQAWLNYQEALKHGIVPEVARMHLPVNIYSKMWATCNARSLMAFLSLRTERPKGYIVPTDIDGMIVDMPTNREGEGPLESGEWATNPSKPLKEIQMVADQLETILAEHMPLTHKAFKDNGRVCP